MIPISDATLHIVDVSLNKLIMRSEFSVGGPDGFDLLQEYLATAPRSQPVWSYVLREDCSHSRDDARIALQHRLLVV